MAPGPECYEYCGTVSRGFRQHLGEPGSGDHKRAHGRATLHGPVRITNTLLRTLVGQDVRVEVALVGNVDASLGFGVFF
jgi:hypothetical protein